MDSIVSFEPGDDIKTLGLTRRAKWVHSSIRIRFPSRIHATPIDCNRFTFGRPGGGGLGFAVTTSNILSAARHSDLDIQSSNPVHLPLVTHYARVMQHVLGVQVRLAVTIQMAKMTRQHFGLGSSVCLACAVVSAINTMCGKPLSVGEMRCLIAHNFVEEFRGRVTRGLETGVGTSVAFRGGISVVADALVEIFHRDFPANLDIVLVDPKTTRPNSDQPESEEMLRRTFFLDNSYRFTKAYDLLMNIIPALQDGDLRRFGEYMWDIQFSGTHLSMIQSYENYGKRIYETLGCLRENGAVACGLSSVGPAIYAIVERHDTASLKRTITKRLKAPYWQLGADNTGILVDHLD
ncbi:hypothetical protein ACFL5F_08175 [Planctomycetota bacterium]